MLFKNPPKFFARGSIQKYLESDLWTWFKELSIGLLRMDFLDNFESFRVDEVSLPVGTEVAIANGLRNRFAGVIPTSKIIVRQTGNGLVTDGQPWNQNEVFLINNGPDPVVISVIFFK